MCANTLCTLQTLLEAIRKEMPLKDIDSSLFPLRYTVYAIYSTCGQGIPLFTESHRKALLSGDGIDAVAPKSAFFRQHVKGGRGGSCCHWQGNGEEWEGRIEREESPPSCGNWKVEEEGEREGSLGAFPRSPRHHRLFSSVTRVTRPYSEKIKGGKKGFGHAKDKRAEVVPM